MFFILSKVLLFLLSPFWWIIFLFAWMLISKSEKRKKILRLVILALFIVFTNPFIYRTLVLAWQPDPVELPADKKYNAGILLGGMAGYDRYNRGYFGASADRFIQAANLYHSGIIAKIIVSGGTGSLMQNEPAEAIFLRTAFLANGVPDSVVIIESRSRNTYENAVYSKQITDSLQLKPPFVLVTSALHMPRSIKVFKKQGFDIIAFPCDYRITPQGFSVEKDMLPNIGLMNEWGVFLKEIVGLFAYKLTGKAA
jgi:uncharacterized SAM-binding protein YcdF (DUF218 family)